MFRFTELVYLITSWSSLAAAHTVIVYPGWRGNNIHTNGTASPTDPSIIPGSLGINYDNGTLGFPYGMQWMYPCEYHLYCALRLEKVLTCLRRWYANIAEPYQMAFEGRRCIDSTRMVPRPLKRTILYQHGIRKRTTQLLAQRGRRLSDHWSFESAIRRHLLSATSSASSELHAKGRRQRNNSSH